jgi:eukaryotic-like serine/threonine-protein kinase
VTIATGTHLGRYEIRSKLGAGGMGEVYLARDVEIGRDVAVKVLPSTFSSDKDRLQRFQQEACAAGALNHPNILSIYDVGKHDGSPYVVSELLQGETLRTRISGTPLSPRRAIDYALQITHGLAAAHEKGIIHRDLKPDNIFITNDGRAKILDFGLAKLTQPDGNQQQTDIPTRRVDTDPGVVMGTVGYMSPEQLKGRAVDQRSDIFSFGAILYEMLSGRRAFHGESTAETMSAILREDPPELSETNQRISPGLERLVHHCLEKNPEERFHSASDLAFAIEALSAAAVMSDPTTVTAVPRGPAKVGKLLPWIIACAFGLLSIGLLPFAISSLRQTPARESVIRSAIPAPENATYFPFNQFALSPDGQSLAFVARGAGGQTMLWLRPLNASTAQPLAGTDGTSPGSPPFWSPNSRFIGFFAGGKLKKIDVTGGPPQTVCDATSGRGGSWNRDDLIIFAPSLSGPLHRVSAAGGTSTPVTKVDSTLSSHRWPYFLPDGHHFLYRGTFPAANENNGIYVGSLESTEQRLIMRNNGSVAFASGQLLFARDTTLMAQSFDENNFGLTGEPVPIAEQLQVDPSAGRAIFSLSDNGILAFQSGIMRGNGQLIWFDRNGKQIRGIGESGFYGQPRLSNDNQKIATSIFDLQLASSDIWIYELARNVPTRFTFDPKFDGDPLWSADGKQIVFGSNRKGFRDIYQKASDSSASEEILFESDENKVPTSLSPDGRFLAFTNTDTKANTKQDIWILPLFGERKPYAFLQAPFDEFGAQFSPDGRWLAYVSDELGTTQVYIAPFPGPGGKWQVSKSGGTEPRWRADGKELYFVSADSKLTAVEVTARDATVEIGIAQALFETRLFISPGTHYDVTRDGKRFLIDVAGEGSSLPIMLMVNWTAELKR